MNGKIIKEAIGNSLYDIERKEELIYFNFAIGFYNENTAEEDFEHIKFHIANIPEVLKGLEFVFRAPIGRGEDYNINSNGDEIIIFSETNPILRYITILIKTSESNFENFHFYFEGYDFPSNGAERVYTPAMLWVTKQLKKIYNDWQKEHPEYERIK